MDLVGLVIVLLSLALVGFLAWLILQFIPMPEPFQKLIIVVMVVFVVLYVLGTLTGHMPLPRWGVR